jgi:DNA adenine methylase
MPSYGGGKSKIGKEIYKVIQKIEEDKGWDGTYFEPFCGLLGVGIHIAKNRRKVIACDSNQDLILMWKELQKGWIPPAICSREQFNKLKVSNDHSAVRAFMGIACAYSGIFFAGYRPNSSKQNFFHNTRTGLLDMVQYLNKVQFLKAQDYINFNPKGKTIYCDPPYKNNNIQSEHFDNFDHILFWDTMRKWSKNNLVFISEYKAPEDFKVVWSKTVGSVYSTKTKTNTEKLFMYTK